MTTPAPDTVVHAVLSALRDAKYPQTYAVTRAQHDAVEDWLQAVFETRREAWRAAGSPDDWDHDIGPPYVGPHFGIMLKNVELLVEVQA